MLQRWANLSKSLNLNEDQPIRAYIGLGFGLALAFIVASPIPPPKKVVALHSATHIEKAIEQPAAPPTAPKPQEAQQPETPVPAPQEASAPALVTVSGSCGDWLAQAGIPATASVLGLLQGESGCNPYAVNSSSGACGIAQELPCGKSGCALGDPICQLLWMNGYVISVYGGWDNAYATWLGRSPHWY